MYEWLLIPKTEMKAYLITGMFQNILALFGAALGQIWPDISKNMPKSQIFIAGHPQMFLLSSADIYFKYLQSWTQNGDG